MTASLWQPVTGAYRPPGRSSRANSANASSRSTYMVLSLVITRSNAPSANGVATMLARWNRTRSPHPRRRARSEANSTWWEQKLTPSTAHPNRSCAMNVVPPRPDPASRPPALAGTSPSADSTRSACALSIRCSSRAIRRWRSCGGPVSTSGSGVNRVDRPSVERRRARGQRAHPRARREPPAGQHQEPLSRTSLRPHG
nr:hypothetical protein [Actinosynnema mirum]